MNIFFLDADPAIAASYMCDKHVVKMITESCQLLSTAHRILDGTPVCFFKNRYLILPSERLILGNLINKRCYIHSHVNHPSAIWVRSSKEHYTWLYNHTSALNDEFVKRYPGPNKVHGAWLKNLKFLSNLPNNLTQPGFTDPPQAMPIEYKNQDAVTAYRAYYNGAKSRFAKWKLGNIPSWYVAKESEPDFTNLRRK